MKNISTRFVLGNILSSILLIWFSSDWAQMNKQLSVSGSDPLYGFMLYAVVILGIVTSTMKGYDVSYNSTKSLKWFEQIFIFILYVMSLFVLLILLGASVNLMFTVDYQYKTKVHIFLIVIACVVGFILLVLEGFFLEHRPNKPLSKQQLWLANLGSSLYSSFGIGICWNTMVIGGGIHFQPGALSFVQQILLMLVMVFPFQRLFWFEVFNDAESKLDYVKVFGSFLLVMASGILPLYLK
jgi:hypothetical protein